MKQEIIEGNAMILEFMGFEPTGKDYGEPTFKGEEKGTIIWPSKVPYHTSWDWLMPVVEKIGSLSYNDSNNKFQPTVERFLENDIESIWRQIVIFITWYNQNSK